MVQAAACLYTMIVSLGHAGSHLIGHRGSCTSDHADVPDKQTTITAPDIEVYTVGDLQASIQHTSIVVSWILYVCMY